MSGARYTIAVIGGTGAEGGGIALRLAQSGHRVIIGSRDAERAIQAGAEFGRMIGAPALAGMSNPAAAGRRKRVMPSIEAWARWAAANASFT